MECGIYRDTVTNLLGSITDLAELIHGVLGIVRARQAILKQISSWLCELLATTHGHTPRSPGPIAGSCETSTTRPHPRFTGLPLINLHEAPAARYRIH